MSKNLSVPVLQKKGRQKKSRPDGRLEQSLKIWWRLLELGRNGVEARVEAAADPLDRTDDHNRYTAQLIQQYQRGLANRR